LASGSAAENQRLRAVFEIAKALTAERDLTRLLNLIVSAAARVVDADRGTLFLLDSDTGELWSKVAQGLGGEIRVPRGSGIVGAAAATGEVLNLRDAYADLRFNHEIDRSTGYHTRNLLAVPMRNTQGDVVGVLQLLNKRQGDFSDADADLLGALGGQAAAAIESALLHEEITKLFEGFVKASVVAIESRDPSTAGHSERVALLSLGLADAVERYGTPSWTGVTFLPSQRMELRYAALLHDFGKVGVREAVLVKAEKLYPQQLEVLRLRLEFAKKNLEVGMLRESMRRVQCGDPRGTDQLQTDFGLRCAEIDHLWRVVQTCNMPTVLHEETAQQLNDLASLQYVDSHGATQPLLDPAEIALLSISRGTLSTSERFEIESHVSHTFRFLSQIPWSRALRRVPEIAHRHHEKLNGSGYPLALGGDRLGIEPRIMAIADIYDALTAADRPYKRAVPHDQALSILTAEARSGALDHELVALFCEADVVQRTLATATAAPFA
jgi:HD-GYP domain-containing protein (c-di-GMP phosphodiesterase class II)